MILEGGRGRDRGGEGEEGKERRGREGERRKERREEEGKERGGREEEGGEGTVREREDKCSHIPNNTVTIFTIPLIFLTSHTQQLLRATLLLCLLHPLADINTNPSQCL